ncbi:hypothetical protein VNO78_15777 [Psophocarpus tetragonolobus]|uniref:Bowman-Birk serine protease inhibitors family domain-containing protein n=1 Tax=Psophocarpus tetragonolobus TaxID=3891 RepID=A0AAN9SEN5_PSOTE
MELKEKVLVKVVSLVLLLGFIASIDAGLFTPCCKICYCTETDPPRCTCLDVNEQCHRACINCVCSASYPPKCRCMDVTTECYEPC